MKTEPTKALKLLSETQLNPIHEIPRYKADIIARIAFSEGQSSPKVKQLEWVYPKTFILKAGSEYAYTPFGKYWVKNWETAYGKDVVWLLFDKYTGTIPNGGREDVGMYDTIDEAKAAAQADFERRVMECLDL